MSCGRRGAAAGFARGHGSLLAARPAAVAGAGQRHSRRSNCRCRARRQASPVIPYALDEHEGKAALALFGVSTPRGRLVPPRQAAETAGALGFPVVIKASGAHLEHKTEVGGVVLNVRSAEEARSAAERLSRLSDTLLVEEMCTDGVAEILIGVIVDPQFGQVLVDRRGRWWRASRGKSWATAFQSAAAMDTAAVREKLRCHGGCGEDIGWLSRQAAPATSRR